MKFLTTSTLIRTNEQHSQELDQCLNEAVDQYVEVNYEIRESAFFEDEDR